MSTNSNPVVTNVDAGVQLFKQRLAPAALSEDQQTINAIAAWILQHGHDVRTLTAQQVSDVMYKATDALLFEKNVDGTPILHWVVKPKKLILREQEGRVQIQKSQAESTNQFSEKVKANEVLEEKKKASTAAIQQASLLIDSISIVRNGKIMHGQTETVKSNLRKKLVKADINNAVQIAKEIKSLVADLYESLEREQVNSR